MKRFMTTTALTLLIGTSAFAQSLSTDADVEADAAGTNLTAQAGAEANTNVVDETNDALAQTGDAIEDGAEATGNALAQTGEEIEDGVEATGNAMAEAGAEIEAGASEMFAGATAEVTSPKIQAGELVKANTALMTSADLEGTVVYDQNDEEIGEISGIVLTSSGQADKAVIDVGGFIGIGEKTVAVPFSQIALMQSDVEADAEAEAEIFVYVNSTEDELEALPEYEDN